jgi:hypothetical protein
VNGQQEAYVGTRGLYLFLFRVNQTGIGLISGAFIGGGFTGGGAMASLAVDSANNCYAAGSVSSTESGSAANTIPTTPNALQNSYSNQGLNLPGLDNGYILIVNSLGTGILYGTYSGPRYYRTDITSFAVASDGSLYFSGSTNSDTFTATPGPTKALSDLGTLQG